MSPDDNKFPSGEIDLLDRLRQEHSKQIPPDQSTANPKELDEIALESMPDLAEDTHFKSGSMPSEARRTLVSLLRYGVVLASQKSKLFDSVCRYQSAIRNHLSDMYLKLVLDEKAGVAFVAQLDESDNEDDEAVSLITRRTLSIYDTLLLLVLRKFYQERESSGEQRIIIDIERIEDNLFPFLALTNSTKSDRRKLNAALKKMIEKKLLSSVRSSDDRFEITPIIRYVVNAEFLENMLVEYQRLASEVGVGMNLQTVAQEESDQEGDGE